MIETLTVGNFQENCHLVAVGGELAVIDPGDEAARIIKAIEASGKSPRYILLTHAHLDHVGAAKALQDRFDLPLYCPAGELQLLESLALQCQLFGLPVVPTPRVDRVLSGDEVLPLGNRSFQAIPTPGHSPGGTCYRLDDQLFVGDTLFAGGVGRVDLWGGSWPTLEASIRERLFTLPDDLAVHPGHGPATTIGTERRSNPFFN